MEIFPQQLGKLFIVLGIGMVLLGVLVLLGGKIGLFGLPGDLQFGSKSWRVFLPIATCIFLSFLATLILWLINYFRR